MPFLRPFQVGNVTYRDVRSPLDYEQIVLGNKSMDKWRDVVLDAGRDLIGEDPGCGFMRDSAVQRGYGEYRAGGGALDLAQWRTERETQRTCPDPDTGEAFRLHAWDGDTPVGGMLMVNVSLRPQPVQGVVHYTAGVGPFVPNNSIMHDFLIYMLKNSTIADGGVEVQLDQWTFHRLTVRNRWDTRLTFFEGFMDRMDAANVRVFTAGGQRPYVTGLRLQ